ncbi:MAG: Na+:solute symporter [Phycisphaerales bacterium]|nr:Na+:solute symporter [Phycisphaerales bacterium]
MQLTTVDWIVLAGSVILIFTPALFFARRAGKDTTEFFVSGRSGPWWLVGTSMVATTFSTDTPGLVTQFVREDGIAKNWAWWAFLLTGMATVFFYARLWRRAGLVTDLEFYEIRYAGPSAALVRGFRAVYLGLVYNCFIIATVTLAAVKIASVLFGIPAWQTIVFAIILCSAVSAVSGLWGVLVSDLVQFVFAMTGSLTAAYFALKHPAVGGLDGLIAGIDPSKLGLLPDFGNWQTALAIFILPLTVQWWSAWYPGSEPGGGSYIAQRILAAKDERHAAGATLWFNAAHYALRPWPWIIVGLASLLVFPNLESIRTTFPHIRPDLVNHDMAYPAMLTFVPAGMLGIITASLLAAYVSTMSTQLNLGTSYLIHDLYRRFLVPNASQHHYIRVSRVVTVLLMVVGGSLVAVIDSAGAGFQVLLTIGAGTGLIYLLRWFWWRINAWSEIAAMVSSFAVSITILVFNHFQPPDQPPLISAEAGMLYTVGFTTVVWLVVTFLTPPVERNTLIDFCRRIQPAGPGWRWVREAAGVGESPDSLTHSLLCWILGCAAVYSVLFGTGSLLFGHRTQGFVLLGVAVVSTGLLFGVLRSRRRVAPAKGV